MLEQTRIVLILNQVDALRRKRAEVDQKVQRISQALFHSIFGDPADWENDHRALPLSALAAVVSGGTPSGDKDAYWTGDIPWVSPKDMKRDYIDGSADHITREAMDKTGLKLISPGSVLIVVRGMILAHTVPVGIAAVPLTINQDMKALVPSHPEISACV